ncbi:c-type cytochrome [Tabrizicola sp.]|uniref:c-type cytochrome n=1 Tax=Tabrizicola sp. TaxID=2005166 RepID=UPI003D267762
MKTFTKTLVISAMLMSGAAFAAGTEATDPDVIARKDLMKSVVAATKVLGTMASGEVAHDAAAAEAAKQALIAASGEIEAKFTNNAADPASEAKAEVWTNWEDFLAKGKALGDAAGALDVASAESIGAGMGAIGGTCKDCHSTYRVQK